MKPETKRLNLVVDAKVAAAIEALATFERRSINLQSEILFIEALVARGVIEKPEPPKLDL